MNLNRSEYKIFYWSVIILNQILKLVSSSLLVILILSGCSTNNSEQDNIFKYKDSYVGDASAVGNSARMLQSAEYYKGFELKTAEKPYGIVLNYDWSDTEQNYKKTAIYNATFLFVLFKNADWITFNFDEHPYKITKENLQNWYGEDLSNLKSEDETKNLAEIYLEDEPKTNQLFN